MISSSRIVAPADLRERRDGRVSGAREVAITWMDLDSASVLGVGGELDKKSGRGRGRRTGCHLHPEPC